MSPRLEALLILQNRQQALATARANLDRLPKERAALETQIAADAAQLEAHREAARKIESDRKQLELEVESKESAIARYKAQQLDTRKNEEYQALTHEIENTGKQITALEDRELELMEAYEEANAAIAQEEEAFKAVEARNNQKLATFEEKKANLEQRATEAATELKEAQGKVSDADRSLFERLFERRGGNAIVPIEHNTCTGCHMKVTSQTEITARSEEKLAICENCGRIVYVKD